MIVINKAIHTHDSIGMINKLLELSKIHPSSVIEKTELCDTSDIKKYRKDYKNLPTNVPLKRKHFGLSCKAFKTKPEYVKALKEKQVNSENKELREFIEDQLIGGFSWDECCFLI